ncbi:hemerythrin domain-containing protein [Microbispora sp. H10830]|uniref:hemerythrin domain-containing protein n=1 Tax=Microbispora sp. H10830 TaxID=2729109 RepID=UPI0016029C78|nr:hemerythrin domain-containing protein [Microbispora sp. H10830]
MTRKDNAMDPRVIALGDELVKLHDSFRRRLAELRTPGSRPDLREHCLTFCEALHVHHAGEDDVLFPHLDGLHPELAGVLARLRREHRVVGRILARIRALLDGGDPEIAAELDRLAGELEAHLDYEEEQLVPLLNQMVEFPEGL